MRSFPEKTYYTGSLQIQKILDEALASQYSRNHFMVSKLLKNVEQCSVRRKSFQCQDNTLHFDARKTFYSNTSIE